MFCMCTCSYVCTGAWASAVALPVHACEARLNAGRPPQSLSALFAETGSLADPGAHRFSLAGRSILLSLTPQGWNFRHTKLCVVFTCGRWGLNSGPHACTECSLPTEPSPPPLKMNLQVLSSHLASISNINISGNLWLHILTVCYCL